MQKAWIALSAILICASQLGCQTSCGKHEEPLLWADGITSGPNGQRTYRTTPIDGTWLHFPSYRRFRLPHHLGTRDPSIKAYISLAADRPVLPDAGGTDFALSTAAEVLVTIEDENTVVVENTTCENSYYLFVSISENPSSSADAGS
jgi:hypothetical protein